LLGTIDRGSNGLSLTIKGKEIPKEKGR